ncbi:hypothetical protein [Streptomyces sp. NPDC005336]|uniref:hypothetical protein n=1 Tax=unclassified Streptomyces TaxID=2593676 RepID=UPI0033BB0AA4
MTVQAVQPQRRTTVRDLRRYAHTTIGLCRLGPDAVALGAATLPVRRFLAHGARPPRISVP